MAVTLTVAQAREDMESGAPDAVIQRWIAVAKARIDNAAPDASEDTQNLACMLILGFWNDTSSQGSQLMARDDTYEVNVMAGRNAWHHSGAAAVLAPWVVRRGGVIEEDAD